jgi:hypothetical protein
MGPAGRRIVVEDSGGGVRDDGGGGEILFGFEAFMSYLCPLEK